MELAEDQVGAVAPEIRPFKDILCGRQGTGRHVLHRVEQRAVGVEAVLVAVAEQDLAKGEQIAVLQPVSAIGHELALPIEPRLAHPVGKAERLDLAEIKGGQGPLEAERLVPVLALNLLLPRLEPARLCEQHEDEVWDAALLPAPFPLRGCVRPHVAKAARAAGVPGHPDDELVREARDGFGRNRQCLQALTGERHLQRRVGRRVRQHCCRDRRCLEPGPRRFWVHYLQEEVGGLAKAAVPEAHDALDVVVFNVGLLGDHGCPPPLKGASTTPWSRRGSSPDDRHLGGPGCSY
jgi:hypothetical protein